VLVRELTESDIEPPLPPPGHSVEGVCAQADANKIGGPYRQILQAATGHGLFPYPYKASIKYAAPSNHARSLFTVWSQPTSLGQIQVWIGPESFAKFYPVTEEDVVAELGPGGWRRLSPGEVDGFTEGLHRLFARMQGPADEAVAMAPLEPMDGSVPAPIA
jgi:hypothetical protein